MWFFSADPSKDFQYELGETVQHSFGGGVFTMNLGTHKVTKAAVSIFCYSKKDEGTASLAKGQNALKRLKTIRHPNVLTYIDSHETDSYLLIVTEPVKPLIAFLPTIPEGSGKQLYLSWGFMSICKAVAFLNQNAKITHNDVGIHMVFVNNAGEWKLGGFNLASDINASRSWTDDSYGLGTLIWEIYNTKRRNSRGNQLSNSSKIPAAFRRVFDELISSPHSRPSAFKILESGLAPGGCFRNDLVITMEFLAEIHIKNKDEIYNFRNSSYFNNFRGFIKDIPECTAKFKILPQLIQAYEYGCDGACVLPPLLEIVNYISDSHFESEVVPFLTKAFNSNDRATRSLLLQNLEHLIERIPANVVNESLFPKVLNGFLDTNPVIREQTLKAMVHVAPKLNEKNLNSELMVHFARLLSKDDQGGIRTNTVVCLTKIGHHMNPQNRRTVLQSAFLRSLNDPFFPVRYAGTLGFAATQQYFTTEDIIKRILPALITHTVDPEKEVRDCVFKTVKGYLSTLEKISENPELKSQMEEEALSSKKPTSSWAEWATTALTSKFSFKMDRKQEKDNETPKGRRKSVVSGDIKELPPQETFTDANVVSVNERASPTDSTNSLSEQMKYTGFDADDDNWDGDNWEPIEDESFGRTDPPSSPTQPTKGEPFEEPFNRTRAVTNHKEERRKSRSGPMKLGTREKPHI